MKEKIKYIITIVLSAALIFGFSAWFLLKAPTEYSEAERRVLALLPSFSVESLLSGDFTADFEDAAPDQFPLRDVFRSIKAYAAKYIFNRADNNKIFLTDGHLSKLEYPMNEDMIEYAGGRFGYIYDSYLSETDAEIYLSMIPDKNYFIAEENGYPAFDYNAFAELLREKLPYAEYIEIMSLLSADDYYTTDTHWKQECIVDIAEKLSAEMGVAFDGNFTENKIEAPFYGVYYNQSGLKVGADEIIYLTNSAIDNCTVTNYDTGMAKKYPVYDMSKLGTPDLYEIFLSGTVALSVIENPEAEEKNELILFRDSFGSSIAPLMIQSYSKITVVDIRYIAPEMLGDLVDFENADKVLFLYSTVLLNSASAMK